LHFLKKSAQKEGKRGEEKVRKKRGEREGESAQKRRIIKI
jgi:hypothetical protein